MAVRYASLIGGAAGVLAYFIWGIAFLYWYELRAFPPGDLLAIRILSSLVWLGLFLGATGKLRALLPKLASPAIWLRYGTAGAIVAVNWGAFMVASVEGRPFDASLGYFLVPIVSIALGTVCLRERMTVLQWTAIGLAGAAIVNLVGQPSGIVVWIPLTIGLTFGFYGYLKKTGPLNSVEGLLPETMVLAVPATLWLLSGSADGGALLHKASVRELLLLAGTGLLSVLPLVLFAYGTQRLKLISMGFLQYVTPSTHFLIGVIVFAREPTASEGITFGLIWIGLALVTWSSVREGWTARVLRAAPVRE